MKVSNMLGSLALTLPLAVAMRAEPPPAPDGMKWVQIPELSDEFNSNQVDPAKWQIGPNFQPKIHWRGRPPSEYSPDNVEENGGYLRLKTTPRTDHLSAVHDPNRDIWVNAAGIRSVAPLATYGYYEARMKASRIGTTSSFWMQGKYSEIDIIESMGKPAGPKAWRPNDMHSSTHFFPNGWATDKFITQNINVPSSVSQWHTYGVWWKDADTVEFYQDGVLVYTQKVGGKFAEGMWIFFDTEVFASQGLPRIKDLNDSSKNTMLVDWVRSYKLQPAQ